MGITPNPAVSSSQVVFHLEEPGPAGLLVFDISGRLVRTLAYGSLPGGTQDFTWDLCNDRGARVPAGVYFLRVITQNGESTRRLVVLP